MIAEYTSIPVRVLVSDPLTEDNIHAVVEWINGHGSKAAIESNGVAPHGLVVDTFEGPMLARLGDRIIRGTRDEFYPIKPGPFFDKYRPLAGMPNPTNLPGMET